MAEASQPDLARSARRPPPPARPAQAGDATVYVQGPAPAPPAGVQADQAQAAQAQARQPADAADCQPASSSSSSSLSPTGAPAQPPRSPDPPPAQPLSRREAERLLWRAGFGPGPGQVDDLTRRGVSDAVLSLPARRVRPT